MKRTLLSLSSSIALTGAVSATVTFHSDFDEATLAATGLTIDTPNTTGANSGTVTLNTTSDTLDLTANGADQWKARDGAPIAFTASPTVALGVTWYVETQITHVNSADTPNTNGGARPGYDQAGITFYSGTLGANLFTENSIFVGISDWIGWNHQIQGFGDNDPLDNSTAAPATAIGSSADLFYRVEITENGSSDLYNFFYKDSAAAAWTQFGPNDLSQNFDNTNVGLMLKSQNLNTTASTSFHSLTLGVIPEPSTSLLVGLAGLSLVFRRRK